MSLRFSGFNEILVRRHSMGTRCELEYYINQPFANNILRVTIDIGGVPEPGPALVCSVENLIGWNPCQSEVES